MIAGNVSTTLQEKNRTWWLVFFIFALTLRSRVMNMDLIFVKTNVFTMNGY